MSQDLRRHRNHVLRLKAVGILTFLVLATSLDVTASRAASPKDVNDAYHFSLTRGHGTPVCDAYLERLNSVDYEHAAQLPFCDRPESDVVAGFTLLNRVPLTLVERNDLLVNVYNFTRPDREISADRVKEFFSPFYGKIGSPIWRYYPRVDIDNDGIADNVIVWNGLGAEAGYGACGSPYRASGGKAWRSVQQAYILSANSTVVDTARTHAVFWRPNRSGIGIEPIGQSVSIFEYDHKYYFDAFAYGPKSFDDGRSDPMIANTLGVFFHRNGMTRQICEYRMRDPELR